MKARFETVLVRLREACERCYGDRLVSLAIYGSVGRGAPRPDSDVDFLIIAEDLPNGRLARVREFEAVEKAMKSVLARERSAGFHIELSPIFKSPDEVKRGSPLFLDMTEDARILFDRGGFFANAMIEFKSRLDSLGAKRIWIGDAWYWDLKPDYKPGEVFEL
jgi:predicted nucleotidyltransferase